MTKKHFIRLADAIQIHNKVHQNKFHKNHLDTLAMFCREQNPRFNEDRWLSYIKGECGPNGGAIKPPRKPRVITPERKLARRLQGVAVEECGV